MFFKPKPLPETQPEDKQEKSLEASLASLKAMRCQPLEMAPEAFVLSLSRQYLYIYVIKSISFLSLL